MSDYYNSEGISQSKIKKFIESKDQYKAVFIDNTIEATDTSNMKFGRFYHTYLYEFEKLKDLYQVLPVSLVVGGAMGKFIEAFVDLPAEQAYYLSGFEQSFNTTWKSFSEGKNSNKYKAYHECLLNAQGKTIVSDVERNIVKKMREVYIKENDFLKKAVREKWMIFPEQEIHFKCNFSNLLLKMKADQIYIKSDFSKVIIEDAKTTEDINLENFKYSIKKFRYDIQQSFYKIGVQNWIENKFDKIIPYENIEFIFIPQRKNYPYEILDFVEIDLLSENKAYEDWTKALVNLEYCMSTNNWNKDKSTYEGNRKIIKIW
jgi:hypothetical protein